MNYLQYMKPGGNFGDKLKTGIKKFLKAAGEASRMAKDARVNNPGATMIRDTYAKGDKELAKLLTDEMQVANLTGIALGSGTAPLITGFTIAPVTTGATLATGLAGGTAGMYGTDKAINYFSDGKYTGWGDWANQATNGAIGKNTADFFHPGTIFGGLATGKIGNKIVGVTNRGKLELLNSALNKNILATTLQPTVVDEAVLRGQLGWAPKQTIPYRHGSLDPELKTFVPKHDRWDVVTHGADPNMYFVTDLSTPVSAANMMDLRSYQYTGSIVAEKPMVQVGDFNIAGKNATRNQLIARARQQGADTYLLQDIVDNKAPHLNIVARFIGPEGEAVQGGALLQTKTTPTKTSLAFFERQPANISEVERLGISKLLRHSILKPSMAKYEAKLIGDNKIEVLDYNGNKIGYIQLRSKGNDLEVGYIERNKEYTLPEGEKFQEIGFEAARQYASKLGKRLSTSDSFEYPLYLIPVIAEGFQTRPIKNKNRIHWNADPTDANMDLAARIQIVKNRLQLHEPFLTFSDMDEALDLSNLSQLIPIDSRGNSVSIYSLPELYDYKGRFIKPKWWQYIEGDYQSGIVYDELLDGYNVPGFYESWIGKPKRNFGVKFHFKSGGPIKIKKQNRGKFTDYCGGKVTEECIRKGKNSSNPTTRKRANFAWVARHKFKHADGNKINYLNIFQ